MGAKKVADLIHKELLRGIRYENDWIHPPVDLPIEHREGTWTRPGAIEFDLHGRRHVLDFWVDANNDEFIADRMVRDIRAIAEQPETQASATEAPAA